MSDTETRQADVYRGVRLPVGMTPSVADRLEGIIYRAMMEEIEYPLETGIKCFEAIAGTLGSTQGD